MSIKFWLCIIGFFIVDFGALAAVYYSLPNTRALNSQKPILRKNIPSPTQPEIWIKPNGRDYVVYHKIPKSLRYSVILLEDSRFYDHRGFDFFEIKKALGATLTDGRRLRGASTISQQLVKNIYLTNDRSYQRKFIEALITLKLEAHLSKQRILELYFNGIDWGRGVIGIRAAARHYFANSPERLTIKQSVFLAAIIPNPARFGRDPDSHFVQTRMMRALEYLYRSRIISLEEYVSAVNEEI